MASFHRDNIWCGRVVQGQKGLMSEAIHQRRQGRLIHSIHAGSLATLQGKGDGQLQRPFRAST